MEPSEKGHQARTVASQRPQSRTRACLNSWRLKERLQNGEFSERNPRSGGVAESIEWKSQYNRSDRHIQPIKFWHWALFDFSTIRAWDLHVPIRCPMSLLWDSLQMEIEGDLVLRQPETKYCTPFIVALVIPLIDDPFGHLCECLRKTRLGSCTISISMTLIK